MLGCQSQSLGLHSSTGEVLAHEEMFVPHGYHKPLTETCVTGGCSRAWKERIEIHKIHEFRQDLGVRNIET